MTTATTELFASTRTARPANAMSPLLSVLAVILGVQLRETLSTQSTAQDDAAYAWGM